MVGGKSGGGGKVGYGACIIGRARSTLAGMRRALEPCIGAFECVELMAGGTGTLPASYSFLRERIA